MGEPLTWGANNTQACTEKLLCGEDISKKSCLFGQNGETLRSPILKLMLITVSKRLLSFG